MRQAREIIRLKFRRLLRHGRSPGALALRLDRSRDVEARRQRGPHWPLPEGLNDGELEAALYANRRSRRGHRRLLSRIGRRSTAS